MFPNNEIISHSLIDKKLEVSKSKRQSITGEKSDPQFNKSESHQNHSGVI